MKSLREIAIQIEALYTQNTEIDYTEQEATAFFNGMLDAATKHKFLKDKVSLHLVNKYFNELVKDAQRKNDIYSSQFKTFEDEI